MEEQLISFETAKLAKVKGFNVKCSYWHYTEQGNYDPINCSNGVVDFNSLYKKIIIIFYNEIYNLEFVYKTFRGCQKTRDKASKTDDGKA